MAVPGLDLAEWAGSQPEIVVETTSVASNCSGSKSISDPAQVLRSQSERGHCQFGQRSEGIAAQRRASEELNFEPQVVTRHGSGM